MSELTTSLIHYVQLIEIQLEGSQLYFALLQSGDYLLRPLFLYRGNSVAEWLKTGFVCATEKIRHFYVNVLIIAPANPTSSSLYCDYLTWTNSRDAIIMQTLQKELWQWDFAIVLILII